MGSELGGGRADIAKCWRGFSSHGGQASAPEKQKRSLAKHDQSADDEPSEPQQQCGREQFASANTQADRWFSRRPWLLKMKTVAVQPRHLAVPRPQLRGASREMVLMSRQGLHERSRNGKIIMLKSVLRSLHAGVAILRSTSKAWT